MSALSLWNSMFVHIPKVTSVNNHFLSAQLQTAILFWIEILERPVTGGDGASADTIPLLSDQNPHSSWGVLPDTVATLLCPILFRHPVLALFSWSWLSILVSIRPDIAVLHCKVFHGHCLPLVTSLMPTLNCARTLFIQTESYLDLADFTQDHLQTQDTGDVLVLAVTRYLLMCLNISS